MSRPSERFRKVLEWASFNLKEKGFILFFRKVLIIQYNQIRRKYNLYILVFSVRDAEKLERFSQIMQIYSDVWTEQWNS